MTRGSAPKQKASWPSWHTPATGQTRSSRKWWMRGFYPAEMAHYRYFDQHPGSRIAARWWDQKLRNYNSILFTW